LAGCAAKFKALYHERGAVEREFGYLKHEWALLPLRVRRIQRVKLYIAPHPRTVGDHAGQGSRCILGIRGVAWVNVPDDELFQSAWMKCFWAVAQAKVFEAEIKSALKKTEADPPFTTRQEYHPEFHGFSVQIDSIRPVNPRWGLMLGDIVHGLRSSLDHLAWAIVSRGKTTPVTLTPKRRTKIYFPIGGTRTWFNNRLATYLPGATRKDIAIIRKVQPYIGGEKAAQRHPLTALRELSDADKHRTVQPVWLRSGDARYEVTKARQCIVRRIRVMHPSTLQVGAELARVYVKKTGPKPDIALKGHIATSVAIYDGTWLPTFLESLCQIVPFTLGRFSEPRKELKELWYPFNFSPTE
jgi:hypothetical protein